MNTIHSEATSSPEDDVRDLAINIDDASDPTVEKKQTSPYLCCFSPPYTCKFSWGCVVSFFINNFLVIGLLIATAIALAVPLPGRAIDSVQIGPWHVFQSICIIIIFIISGLTLLTDEVKTALREWPCFFVGVISILLITPCAAFALMALPLTPVGYKYGLALFALTPASIASGVTFVKVANGNVALAILLTIFTNIVGVFILPYTVNLVLGSGNINLQPVELMLYLIIIILVPTLIGKFARELSVWIRQRVETHETALGFISSLSLIIITWLTVSTDSDAIVHTAFGTLCLVVVASMILHLVYLIVNGLIVYILRFPGKEAIAVFIMASEKTLPMALAVVAYLPESFGSSGQLIVAGVIANIVQIIMDSLVAAYIRKRGDAAAAAAAVVVVLRREERKNEGNGRGSREVSSLSGVGEAV